MLDAVFDHGPAPSPRVPPFTGCDGVGVRVTAPIRARHPELVCGPDTHECASVSALMNDRQMSVTARIAVTAALSSQKLMHHLLFRVWYRHLHRDDLPPQGFSPLWPAQLTQALRSSVASR